MENAARKTKTKMTAAERKRKQRGKAQANMTETEKEAYKQKENQRHSRLRRVQIAKMRDKERSNFHAKEVAPVTASRKGKKQKPQLQVKIPAKNRYKSRQSFGKALNRCRTELPHSLQEHTAVVSGLGKEVGLSIQSNYEKHCHGNPSLSDELKEAVKEFSF